MLKNVAIFIGGAVAGAYVMYNKCYKCLAEIALKQKKEETEEE